MIFPGGWWRRGSLRAVLAVVIAANDLYSQVFTIVSKGVLITIFVTLVGFALASGLGLLLALMSLSGSLILRQTARFYVEIIRGRADSRPAVLYRLCRSAVICRIVELDVRAASGRRPDR